MCVCKCSDNVECKDYSGAMLPYLPASCGQHGQLQNMSAYLPGKHVNLLVSYTKMGGGDFYRLIFFFLYVNNKSKNNIVSHTYRELFKIF